ANRRQIVVAKYGIGSRSQLQQLLHCLKSDLVASFFNSLAHNNVALRSLQLTFRQRISITPQSVERGAGVLASNVGDSLAADLNQVPCGHLSYLHIIGSDEIRRQMRKVAVEEEVWRPGITQFIKVAQIRLARSDQENIHSTVQQGTDLLPL